MDYRVLGPLEVCDGRRVLLLGGHRQRMVLAVLLLHANRAMSTDWLIDAVWGEAPPATARKTLQSYVSRLRGVLGASVLEASPQGYLLIARPDEVDACRFEQLAREGNELVETDPAAAAGILRGALALWRGVPWGDLADAPAFQPDAERLRELRLVALEDRIAADAALGHSSHLIGELRDLVAQHPWRERLSGQLMLALYRSGRQADALRTYRDLRRSLVEEFGIDPSPELQHLEQRILLQDDALDVPERGASPESRAEHRNPFKGLHPFGEADAADFCGRQTLLDELCERVAWSGMVAVVGASGSGKSSVVRAGLIPAIRTGVARISKECRIATMLPGVDPFAELLAAFERAAPAGAGGFGDRLRGDDLDLLRVLPNVVATEDERLVLVIDQFEELFVVTERASVRDRFVRNLIEAVEDPGSYFTVVLTLRADFFDRALDQPGLGNLITKGMVNVLPMAPAELEAAVVGPAAGVGVSVEPELIAELVADMTDQPGALPLLQFVLTELFDQRLGNVLSLQSYIKLGGLRGALERRAEEIYAELSPEQQVAGRQVFLRLVTLGEGTEDTRCRVPRTVMETLVNDAGSVEVVLDHFDHARLLSFDRDAATNEPTVELAHEALLREWGRLRHWIAEARDDLRLERLLATEAREWLLAARDPDYLLTGSRLDVFDSWRTESTLLLDEQERQYLDASVARRTHEQAADEARRQQQARLERRAVRRLRLLVAVVSIAALVGAGLTLLAADRTRDAQASQREAHARELANAAVVNLDRDPELGILLALEAIDTTRSHDGIVLREAEDALHAAVNAHRSHIVLAAATDVAFLPSGYLLVGGEQPAIVDPDDGSPVSTLDDDGPAALSVAVAHDGGRVAVGSSNGSVSVWDVTGADGSDVEKRWGSDYIGAVTGLQFSQDGAELASVSPDDQRLRVWDAESGDLLQAIAEPEPGLWGVDGVLLRLAFDPTGSRIAVTGARDGTVRIYDVGLGEWELTLSGHAPAAIGIEFSSDGTRVVTGAYDGTVKVWDAASGRELYSIDSNVGQVVGLDLSLDGSMLAVGGTSGSVEIWEPAEAGARLLSTLEGHEGTVSWVAFDATGTRLATSGSREALHIWDLAVDGGYEWATFEAWTAAFAPDGETLGFGGPGRDVTIVDAQMWSPVVVLAEAAPYVADEDADSWVVGIAVSPDGTMIATSSHSFGRGVGRVQLWDAVTGRVLRTLSDATEPNGSMAFSPDGARLAVAQCAGGSPAHVWDVTAGQLVFAVPGTGCGHAVDVGPDGRLLSVQVGDSVENVRVWEIDTGRPTPFSVSHLPSFVGSAEFHPDGERLLTAGSDGRARTWDIGSGDSLMRFEEHDGAVEHAAWSQDGKWVATGDAGGTVRIWNATTGDLRIRLVAHTSMVVELSFSPDGRRLVSTDAGGSVRVWAIDPDDLVRIAEARLTRGFTNAECVTYHLDGCPAP